MFVNQCYKYLSTKNVWQSCVSSLHLAINNYNEKGNYHTTQVMIYERRNGAKGYNALFIQLVEKNGTKSMVGINLNCANQCYTNYNHIGHNIECQN